MGLRNLYIRLAGNTTIDATYFQSWSKHISMWIFVSFRGWFGGDALGCLVSKPLVRDTQVVVTSLRCLAFGPKKVAFLEL